MRCNHHFSMLCLAILLAFFVTGIRFQEPLSATRVTPSILDESSQAKVLERYANLPLHFEANWGQTADQVRFLSRGRGYTLFLTPTEAVLAFSQPTAAPNAEEAQASEQAVLRMQLVGVNPEPLLVGLAKLPGQVNYFIGNDPKQWRTHVPSYTQVKYQAVYPGIDLVYYGNQRQLEYDFIVAPGADPDRITLGFAGADTLEVDAQGDLVLHTAGGAVRQHKPVIYQQVDGVRQAIAGGYVLKDMHQIGFQVAAYDRSQPLIIDPVLVYATFLGGSSNDRGFGISVDAAGNAYVAVRTESTDFPITGAPFQNTNTGNADIAVTKLNASGSGLVYSTYFGGSGNDGNCCLQLTIDAAGNAYVTGDTTSTDFPTTSGAFQPAFAGGGGAADDAFVTKLNATGSGLVYSTYLGGSDDDAAGDIAVDAAGNAYVTGSTRSNNFPTTSGAYQPGFGGGGVDAFVTKLNSTGTDLVYSTYLGRSSPDSGGGIAVDAAGNAYAVGMTLSTDFPTTSGAFQTGHRGGLVDVYVTKLNAAGSGLVYSTFLGGSGEDHDAAGVAVDAAGNAYLTGYTFSTDFPTQNPFQPSHGGGGRDAYVTKLNAAGSALVYSTYLGGSGVDVGSGIALDGDGNVYVTGSTTSTNFPTTPGAFPAGGGSDDAYVTKLNSSGSALVYSTYLGGSGFDQATKIAVDAAGNAYVTGGTNSTNFSTTPGAFQPVFGGGAQDAFVVKLVENRPPTVSAGGPYSVDEGDLVVVTATGNDPDEDPLTYSWDLDHDGNFETPGQSVTFSAANLDGPSSQPIAVQVTDSGGLSAIDQTTVDIVNVAPTVGAITAPIDPVAVNTAINTNVSFSDPSVLDTHTAVWDWDDGTTSAGTVNETNGAGSVSGSHTYATAGIYTIKVTVTDDDGDADESIFFYLVVYDPSGGFVTGGGWIASPAGAYAPDPALTGKANFGFVAKYKKGATTPTGQTEFQFQMANLNFHSASYDWLVVAGAKAQYKGAGTINGSGAYGFMITAIDGARQGGGGSDQFRIKIWDKSDGDTVVYDNQRGASEDSEAATTIGGGSIVIHTGGGRGASGSGEPAGSSVQVFLPFVRR